MVDSDSFANGRKFSVLILVQYDHQVADFSHQHAEQPSQPPAGDQGGAVHRPMAQNIRSFVIQVLSHRVSPHPCLYVQKKIIKKFSTVATNYSLKRLKSAKTDKLFLLDCWL